MLSKLKTFLQRPTSKDIIINTCGNYLNVAFTAFFALLLVRIFGPEEYGVLSVLLGIAYVLANVMDFGTTATIYSYLPTLVENKAKNIYCFIKSTFFYQSLFSIIIIIILFFAFPFLDQVFFKTGAPLWELYLTAIMVLFLIWQNFALNILYAAKKFLKANIYLNTANLIKTLVIIILTITKSISIGAIIFVFGILGPIIFFLLLLIEKKDLIFIIIKAEVKREEFRFGYTLTFFIANQFLNLGLRMDLFLLSFFSLKSDVGYYGLAQKIILTILTSITSITQVLSPGFSKIKTKTQIKHQLKVGFMSLFLPAGLFFLLSLVPDLIFNLFFTAKYLKTAQLTRALALPFIIFTLINLPQLFLLYTVKKPQAILVSNIIFFIVISIICYWLIPQIGVYGAVYAVIAAMLASATALILSFINEYRQIPV
jgi:O-antigen/teichoic acid export membrane protein